MAETLISPGVLARENDQSFITQQPVQVGASIVGPTVKGPVEIPTIVTSYSDYQNRFGTTFESGSDTYSFFTSIAAQNYFNNGGNTLLVTRVVSASATWDYASADVYCGTAESGVVDTIILTSSLSLNSFNITSSAGNGPSGEQNATQASTSGTGTGITITASFSTSESIATITFGGGTGYEVGDTVTFSSQSLGADLPNGTDLIVTLAASNIINTVAFTLESLYKGDIYNNTSSILSNNSLESGSANNIRWEIASANTSSGNFSLIVRQGNDSDGNKSVLETWPNLSLDPKSDNYISKVIGDQKYLYNSTGNFIEITGSYSNASRYVRVASVTSPTPDYFDNAGVAKTAYTGFIPSIGSGSYGGSFSGGAGSIIPSGRTMNLYDTVNATDTQGLVSSDYDNMLTLLANADDYRYNILLLPGLNNAQHTSTITTAIQNAQSRGDNMVVIDPVAYNGSVATALTQAASRNTSYAAMYWPWLQTLDPSTGKQVWLPASTLMGGVFAFNDNAGEPWFAPAGINRGGLGSVIRAERKLSQSDRDTLYQGNVNPIATFPGTGVVVYGQKTLQKTASALDRVNVRRLLITLKSYISQVAQNLVFEQNTAATRNNFLAQVNPYLESVQQRQGLYAFKVVMDDSNNTPDVIDRNQLIGAIYIQPTKTAEFIYLDFNILPTGATFPA